MDKSGTCFECKFMRNRTDLEPCEHCTNVFAMTGTHPSFMPRRPLTNADRIRSMTDEELAKKISGIESFALTCGGGWPPEKWLEWLRKEAE